MACKLAGTSIAAAILALIYGFKPRVAILIAAILAMFYSIVLCYIFWA